VSALIGRALSFVGIAFASIGIFVLEGISIEILGIIGGRLGYYFGLRVEDLGGRPLRNLHNHQRSGGAPAIVVQAERG
jgi:hypothetical protein